MWQPLCVATAYDHACQWQQRTTVQHVTTTKTGCDAATIYFSGPNRTVQHVATTLVTTIHDYEVLTLNEWLSVVNNRRK